MNRSWTRGCGLLLVGCLTMTAAVFAADEKDSVYGHSDLFSKEDMDSAVEIILDEFRSWGCELTEIRYAGDANCSEENLKVFNAIDEDKQYTECIEFHMDFHTPVDEKDLGGTKWELDTEYTDYQWWLARFEDEEWELMSWGYDDRLTEADDPADESVDETEMQSYLVHVTDQYGDPVPGLMVNFCTDQACTMQQSDENGTIVFDGEPDVYHIQILKAPEGYSYDTCFEMYTDKEYGEVEIHVKKD